MLDFISSTELSLNKTAKAPACRSTTGTQEMLRLQSLWVSQPECSHKKHYKEIHGVYAYIIDYTAIQTYVCAYVYTHIQR